MNEQTVDPFDLVYDAAKHCLKWPDAMTAWEQDCIRSVIKFRNFPDTDRGDLARLRKLKSPRQEFGRWWIQKAAIMTLAPMDLRHEHRNLHRRSGTEGT